MSVTRSDVAKDATAPRAPKSLSSEAGANDFTPKRGRPTAAQLDAINRAILSSATAQFFAAGFDATTMKIVAARAGVSKSTLYARYPTKEALLDAVIEARVAAWSEETRPFDHLLPKDLEGRLRHHAKIIIRFFGREEIRAFERLVNGPGVSQAVAWAFHERGQRFVVNYLREEIVEGTRNDPAPARNPERIAEMLIAMLYGWHRLEEAARSIPQAEAEVYADRAVDLLLSGRAAW